MRSSHHFWGSHFVYFNFLLDQGVNLEANEDRKGSAKRYVLHDNIMEIFYQVTVRATAVGQDAERNTVLAGDPKGLDYYVILI